MTVGAQIKHYRKKLKWRLKQLAEASDVEIGTLSALETRGSQKSQFIPQIAKAFGLTVEQFLDESTSYQPDPDKFKANIPFETKDSVKSNADPWIDEAVFILQSLPIEDRRAVVANMKTFVMNLGPRLQTAKLYQWPVRKREPQGKNINNLSQKCSKSLENATKSFNGAVIYKLPFII